MRRFFFILIIINCTCSCDQIEKGVEPSGFSKDELIIEANSFYNSNDFSRAVKSYSAYLESDSLCGECYYKRGFSYFMLGYEFRMLSIADFNNSVILKYRVADSYFNLGLLYSYYDDSKAAEYFVMCLSVDPNNVKAKKELTECRRRLLMKGGSKTNIQNYEQLEV